MTHQFFTVLLHDRHLKGHYMVLAASDSAVAAQEQARVYVKQSIPDDRKADIEPLGTFPGFIRPQTSGVLYGSECLMLQTQAARELDTANAEQDLRAHWNRCDATTLVAFVMLDDKAQLVGTFETLTLTLEDDEWLLTTSFDVSERYFTLLSEAVAEANKDIARRKAAFCS